MYLARLVEDIPLGLSKSKVKVEVAQRAPGRLRPRIFLTFRHYKGGRSSAKRNGRLYPRRNPWYSILEAQSISGHMVLSGESREKAPVAPPGIDPGTALTTTLPQAPSRSSVKSLTNNVTSCTFTAPKMSKYLFRTPVKTAPNHGRN